MCPNINNKQVVNEFNEIVVSLGGVPLTSDEFRDSALRSQRTGTDYAAMEAAYRIWDLNNGYGVDCAPNGKPSVLFQTLLDLNNGNRQSAIVAKSLVYSLEFRDWFGDWINNPNEASTEASKRLLDYVTDISNRNNRFSKLAKLLLDNKALPYNLKYFKIDNNRDDVEGADGLWHSLANLIEILGNDASQETLDKKLLHELIHYNTEQLLQDYKDDKPLPANQKEAIKNLYDIIKYSKDYLTQDLQTNKDKCLEIAKRQSNTVGSRLFYAFDNNGDIEIDEFISEIFTNPGLQEVLNNIPYKETKQSLWSKIKDAISSIFGFKINEGSVLEEALKTSSSLIQNNSNVSKVVDENGEPFIAYTGTNKDFNTFDSSYSKTASKGFFFSADKEVAKGYGTVKAVFLNIKNLKEENSEMPSLDLENGKFDGISYFHNGAEALVVWNSNQIKSATNNVGTFSGTNDNIYHNVVFDFNYDGQFDKFNLTDSLGFNLIERLFNGETVSSKEILNKTINNRGMYSDRNLNMVKILQKHDVPVRMSSNMQFGVLASTITDENGGSVVVINREWINKVSSRYAGETMLHEIIHAVTANALSNSKTTEETIFKNKTNKIYNIFKKAIKNDKYVLLDVDTGLYALTNVQEFVSVFMTSDIARNSFYDLAKQIDQDGNVLTKFKQFINSIYKLFVNKNLFKNSVESLKEYELYMYDYLNGVQEIERGNILSDSELIAVYKSMSSDAMFNESITNRILAINRLKDSWLTNNVDLSYGFGSLSINTTDIGTTNNYESILNSLLSRIYAIKSSRLEENVKLDLINLANTQIDTLNNPSISKFDSLSYIVSTFTPHIFDSIDELNRIKTIENLDLSNSNYMYQQHDNIGMFKNILTNITTVLKNERECQDIITKHNELNTDKQIDDQNLRNLEIQINELSGILNEATSILNNILNRAALNSFYNIVYNAGSIEGVELATNLSSENPSIQDDITWFQLIFGQSDASDNEIVRAVAHLITKANDKVDDFILLKGLKLLNLLRELKKGESVQDIYEYDRNGNRTGYIARDLNFGIFEQEYKKVLSEINKQFGLAPENTIAPENEKDRIKWNLLRNNWLDAHCERRYTRKYYDAWAKLPTKTKMALDKINGAILAIIVKYNVLDADGIYHYDRITDDRDWETIQRLWVSKKLLRSPYDELGNEKTGEAKEIADSLINLYKELYGEEFKERDKKISAWETARNAIIELCGGQEQYELYKKGLPNSFNFKELDEWDARNSKVVFKRNKEGVAIVFDQIEQEIHGRKLDYGEEYNQLKEKAKELLNPYYDLAGEVNADFLPAAIKNLLNNVIYKRMYEIRKERIKTIPGYQKLSEDYKKVFDTYIRFVDTRYYSKIKSKIATEVVEAIGDFDFELYNLMLGEYGDVYEMNGFMDISPYKWLLRAEAKNSNYMEIVPNNGWQELIEDDLLLNKNFDESYGSTMVPKKQYYDNSQAYNKITQSETLRNLYNEIVNTMEESNQLLTNRNWSNKYLLPGISAGLYEKLKRANGFHKLSVFWQWVKELFGVDKNSDEDVLLRNETTINDDNDSEGNIIKSKHTRIIGRHPDGRQYMSLPQYYTRKLKNPENISGDLIGMVLSYYKMSVNYSEKLKIRDVCEGMLDYVKNNTYVDTSSIGNKKGTLRKFSDNIRTRVVGGDTSELSNVYQQLKNMLDLTLYNKSRKEFKTKIGNKTILMSAVFNTIRQYTSAINLGWNPKVAAVGFMTALHSHFLNALVGKEYNVLAWAEAARDVIFQLPERMIFGPTSKTKAQVILNECNLAEQVEETFNETNRGRIAKMFIRHNTFGYLATIDYLTKSQIAVAVMKDYKYIDGKIYSKLDVLYLKHDLTKYKELMSKWSKAKSIYDLMDVSNGNISFKDLNVLSAWNLNKTRIKSKCVKLAQKADGVATGLQRAAIQQSWVGMFIMIHRQYLPLMLHERLGKRIYDYDTQEYTHGQFTTAWKFLLELMYNSTIAGTLTAGLAGLTLFGPYGAIAGAATGLGFRAYGKYKKGTNKSIKLVYNEFFKNYSTQKDTINSVENEFAIKQLAYENLIYLLANYLVVQPIANYADDDKANWFLQTLAYWLKAYYFEITGPYNIKDLVSTIKSPTASTSLVDKIQAVANSTAYDLPVDMLYYLSLTDTPSKRVGNSSVYGGLTSWQKALIQLCTPLHNQFEQGTIFDQNAKGPRLKRNYLQRQIMQERSGDDTNIYKNIYNQLK